MKHNCKIGGASGFWGDAALATPQLLAAGDLDFIVYDYLAEITMAILARLRAKSPDLGFATDFVTAAMAPNLSEIAKQGVRIVSNAGGVNPEGCADALRAQIADRNLDLKVAVVTGDDLMAEVENFAASGVRDMFSDAMFPDPNQVGSINAYLGAFPIAQALDAGADIVVTGRCVDSAVTLGACIHHFGWTRTMLDELAGGSLAGHILECGPQATGGNFTDWEEVADSLAGVGYPVAEIADDGSCLISKPAGTGGKVSRGTVAEQMLYEIGDPQAYLLPDVACDFSNVVVQETGPDQVRLSGARGTGVPQSYKTCMTWHNGFRGGHLFGFYGLDAERKAQSFAETALARAKAGLQRHNMAEFSETSVEILGAEAQFGQMRQTGPAREVTIKIAVRHPKATGVALFLKEATGLGLASPPGLCGFAGARPKPSPVMSLFSFLTPKDQVDIAVDGEKLPHLVPWFPDEPIVRPAVPAEPVRSPETVDVRLIDLAWGRSGDKGNLANVGVIAREPEYLPYIWHGLTDERLHEVFGHFLAGPIDRFLLPGSHSINIVLHEVLGGGGTSSLRNDPQGKGYAQLLLATPITIDAAIPKEQR